MSSRDLAQSTVQDAERTIGPSAKWIVLWRGECPLEGQPSGTARREQNRPGSEGSRFCFRLLVLPLPRIGRVGLVGMAESEHQVGVGHAQLPDAKVAEAE